MNCINLIHHFIKLGKKQICAGRYDYITPSILVEKYYEKLEAQHKEFIWFENSAHFPQCTEIYKGHCDR